MALHWDVTKLKNQEDIFVGEGDDKRLDPVIEALIWLQMSICAGGKITQTNHETVFERVQIWERVFGPMLKMPGGADRPITLADVKRCIGLTTNAFGDDGKRAFKERVMKALFEDSSRELRQQKEAMKTTVGVMEESGAA